ncbi:MAG: hypothetical protein ACI9JN_002586, partial [Bacteroidia bacterium]
MSDKKRQKIPVSVLRDFENQLTQQLASHLSLVHELSDILHISVESVYRRLRGNTAFTFDELWRIFKTYSFSLDDIFYHSNKEIATFQFLSIIDTGISGYTQKLKVWLNNESQHQASTSVLIAAHIPLMWLLSRSKLASFKHAQWRYNYDSTTSRPKLINVQEETLIFNNDSIHITDEIWSIHTVDSFIQDIEYAINCDFHISEEELYDLFKDVILLIQDVFQKTQLPEHRLYQCEAQLHANVLLRNTMTMIWLDNDLICKSS